MKNYNQYMVELVYSTVQISANYCKQLSLDSYKTKDTLKMLKTLTLYEDLLYYLKINNDFLTQNELINVCSFINQLTCNTTDIININTITS